MAVEIQDERLWHVTLTVGGPSRALDDVRTALTELNTLRPFLHSMRFDADRAEVQFWEEAESMLDAAALSIRVWGEFRTEIGLDDWVMLGFDVVHRSQHLRRHQPWARRVDVGITPFEP